MGKAQICCIMFYQENGQEAQGVRHCNHNQILRKKGRGYISFALWNGNKTQKKDHDWIVYYMRTGRELLELNYD